MHSLSEGISVSPRAAREIQRLAELLGELPGATVLLLGSAARGELAEGVIGGQHEVFSDYEFMVVTPRRLPIAQQRRLRQAAETLARGFGYRNPLFHVDVTFRERGRLSRMPRTIFTFELKCNARVVSGPDVRDLLPDVNLDNLDWRDTNEILSRRLWAILHAMPVAFAQGKNEGLLEVAMSYLLARNALDLSTVLLPRQGVLLPTYRERVAYWQEHGLEPSLTAMGESFIPFLVRCLEERQMLSFSQPAWSRYPQVIQYLARALELVGVNLESPDSAPSPFHEWPWTRGHWLHLARVMARLVRQHGLVRAITWLRQPRKAIRVVGLLDAHRALIAWQQADVSAAEEALVRSWSWLQRLMPEVENILLPTGPFPERWLALRQQWHTYWSKYIVVR
jgi:predicted nucleotidyltransferase